MSQAEKRRRVRLAAVAALQSEDNDRDDAKTKNALHRNRNTTAAVVDDDTADLLASSASPAQIGVTTGAYAENKPAYSMLSSSSRRTATEDDRDADEKAEFEQTV